MSRRSETVGFALTGSFCTLAQVLPVVEVLAGQYETVIPILSEHCAAMDTRFGPAEHWRQELTKICGCSPIDTIQGAEPIGPKKLLDLLIIAPCTGNTLGKLAGGITDTSVTMAAKAHLRNERPVLIGVSTNDGLSASLQNIGVLACRRNYYFVPFRQDDARKKPCSLVADWGQIPDCAAAALAHRQVQPLLV
ncbi:MAG: dipicolinate synthase subunit B [Clostridiales bacterium]|nr:dipicolinate synthase subunit B [Clostridiales bacterium]